MRLEYDPVAEDFLLIEQGRVIERVFICDDGTLTMNEQAMMLLQRLKRPATRADLPRKPIDAPAVIDESMIKRYDSKGRPILPDLEDLDLDLEELL